MYRCEITGRLSKPGDALHKIVVEKRPKTYSKWFFDEETEAWSFLPCSTGWEIVKELSVSAEGARLWHAKNPEGV